jgi:hypothetical protein
MLHAEMALFLGAADKDGNKRNGFEEKDFTRSRQKLRVR